MTEEVADEWNGRDPREVFKELHEKHADHVYRMARRQLEDDHHAKDVVQQVFLAIWKKLDRDLWSQADRALHSPESIWGLIATIAQRRIIDIQRANGREFLVADHESYLTSVLEVPARLLGSSWIPTDDELEKIRPELDCLTRTEYQVVKLTWQFDLTAERVAELLGISLGSVYTHRSHALRKLRAVIPEMKGSGLTTNYDGGGELPA
ncbi:MAG: sigma-70 family RNA polymerase sigma factor [Mycobacteriaceae bacterium]|nr:sigma-70 family RNA polymerase sigma factor [Mycobacteriaceae bacterium]